MEKTAVFILGMVFALGLGISGMTLPQKVIGFLDVAGDAWDPSLALVMISSAGTFLILHRWVLQQSRPLFDSKFHLPKVTDIDAPLLIGSALFGIGWGTVGFCPGPALAALVSGQSQVWIFFIAMIAGMYAEGTLNAAKRIITNRGEAVDG